MKNLEFLFTAREDSKETTTTTQIGGKSSPRCHAPVCKRPASGTAVSVGKSRKESPPPSPRLSLFEHYADIGEAKAGLGQPREDNTCSGRERLKRHRDEVAGRIPIPDSWGQESFLKDWMDSSAFDTLLAPKGIASAREALMAEGRRQRATTSHQRLRIEGRC